ncbi:hypothetical protein T440DRAFT_477619 [Plenodomus tracheiphilus IPT5]|uniref:Uncharacterized protein n=1 Tax=Plenodomus tracheiphilus IPT5 TaxID=1408161 RepID=A0A6A7BBF1_9PLEO|nr:hypothetical protein T440DRAFT_477619 [Plenodomus tracheiphilus IPT5]
MASQSATAASATLIPMQQTSTPIATPTPSPSPSPPSYASPSSQPSTKRRQCWPSIKAWHSTKAATILAVVLALVFGIGAWVYEVCADHEELRNTPRCQHIMGSISGALTVDKRGVPGTFEWSFTPASRPEDYHENLLVALCSHAGLRISLLGPRTLLEWLAIVMAFLMGLLLCNTDKAVPKNYFIKRERAQDLLLRTVACWVLLFLLIPWLSAEDIEGQRLLGTIAMGLGYWQLSATFQSSRLVHPTISNFTLETGFIWHGLAVAYLSIFSPWDIRVSYLAGQTGQLLIMIVRIARPPTFTSEELWEYIAVTPASMQTENKVSQPYQRVTRHT